MDKLNLSQLGERLKIGGAQMGRMVSDKVKEFKEILQTPTPESRIVDEATSETMEEPNWGLNMRICAMINSEALNGTEIVKAIKRKISGKDAVSQRLSLDLLEACTSNCEKVFSEVASEKVLDEMVKMIDNPQTDPENKNRAFQLIRAWGQSEDLEYLPVFHQTYMNLENRGGPSFLGDGNLPTGEPYIHQELSSSPGAYLTPIADMQNVDNSTFFDGYQGMSVDEKKELIVITRNSVELLSSILNTDTEPKPLKEEVTMSMFEKCKNAQPDIQRIIESTVDDDGLLFEALNLHDQLQEVISKYCELEASQKHVEQHPVSSDPNNPGEQRLLSSSLAEEPMEQIHERSGPAEEPAVQLAESGDPAEPNPPRQIVTHDETKISDLPKEGTMVSGSVKGAESCSERKDVK